MKTAAINIKDLSKSKQIEMVDFYNEATEDYQFWSQDFNMHFGYFIPFKTCVFKRDAMLNEMNNQVINRLGISNNHSLLADLGCGMGGTMRYALKKHSNLSAFGVTLSDFQVTKGNQLLKNQKGTILKENYNHTSFQSNTFDAAVAIESFCHSGHSSESLKEAYRILKPNGKLVIADAFLKKEEEELCYGSHLSYKKLCDHWSLSKLETIDKMVAKLKAEGFSEIKVEDASFRVAPSVLHVPFAILGFMLKSLFGKGSLKRESLHNLKGSFYALVSGLHMKSFGYYIITAKKANQ
ncbi:methyltransferase domain-containing protein [Subsaxibacter sp. CAU 1640]|uniref:methyltransferase domain-containing protein n=1 Tax=Subsaxibacter sp. CAU 1640 TaxID=2933271 RepID=UPI0020033710|nr:methyltransferase domain-containing protein [Subsaxibacter sp. CAU 1640]MCK7591893.1 methyltransferase domain-containing protein [Subsaxibacter sp. CAU 1640]